VRLLAAVVLIAVGGCVTESLSVCINCNAFRVSHMRGGFTVVLTASSGEASPCGVLLAHMGNPITWDGCLQPQGGEADTLRGLIRLSFVDSTGAKGAIEFLNVEGSADSARATWRTSCLKDAVASDCPIGSGSARWFRPPATP